MRHTYKTKGIHLFGYPKRKGFNDKPSDRGRFLIRLAKHMSKARMQRGSSGPINLV